jgi:hypothetical protein
MVRRRHPAGPAVVADREARDHCVAVLKATFRTSPRARRVPDLVVRLDVAGRTKDVLVLGDRRWVRGMPSRPVPFKEMPLVYERAFGGQDDSHGPDQLAVERRNMVGVGFNPHRRDVEGRPLPNLEHPWRRIQRPTDQVPPVGFGPLAPTWEPRTKHAGTYDARWQEEVSPYLPADFDRRFFQVAPEDQRFPRFKGGELLRCFAMAAEPIVQYILPVVDLPVTFSFAHRTDERRAVLDTVVLEPHLGLATLTFRASLPLGKKLNLLRAIAVGREPLVPVR